MRQFSKLSAEAQNTVNFFCNRIFCSGFGTKGSVALIASLYADSPMADPIVVNILNQYIVNLKDYLSQEQIEVLKKEFTNVVLACIESYSENNRSLDDFMIPSGLVDLCLKIAECKPNSKVYLPYNRKGEFSHKLLGCKCDGFELDRFNWAISEILNLTANVESNIKCDSDFVAEPCGEYDYIFTCPPIVLRKEIITSLIHLIAKNLKTGGELYAVLPMDVCTTSSGSHGFDLRKTAKDLNVSIAVLALPEETFQPYTRANTCLIHIRKDGEGHVILADFSSSDFVARNNIEGYKRFELKIDSIIESLLKHDKKHVWCGSYSDLTGSLSFSPIRYLPIENTPVLAAGERLIKLGDLIERITPTRLSVKSIKPIIGNRELSVDYLNCTLSTDSIESSSKETTLVIDNDCLLIGYIGGKVKVARFKGLSEVNSIALRNEVYPFRINSNLITEDYLLRSLLCDYSKEQIVKRSVGAVISRISYKELCEILIKVPSLEEQEKVCYNDAHAGIKEADLKLQKAYDDFRQDIHMKKHAIGQTLANFKNWWKLLNQVRKTGNGVIDENAVIGRLHKVSVKDIFDNLEMSMSKLTTQLNKFDTGYGLVKQEIALTEFIEEYIQQNQSPFFRYEYNARDHRSSADLPDLEMDDEEIPHFDGKFILKNNEPLEYVNFPKEALTTIFNNIVSNACAHGFSDRPDADNIIKIDIRNSGSDYIVSIANNGNPLDANISCNDVTIYGQTSGDTRSHFGIGGYEIKRLMEEFGDEVKIVSEPNEEFKVTYNLIFHETNIVDSFTL